MHQTHYKTSPNLEPLDPVQILIGRFKGVKRGPPLRVLRKLEKQREKVRYAFISFTEKSIPDLMGVVKVPDPASTTLEELDAKLGEIRKLLELKEHPEQPHEFNPELFGVGRRFLGSDVILENNFYRDNLSLV